MDSHLNPQEQSLIDMYRDGVSLHTLEVAFGKTEDETISILFRHGVVERKAGESWEVFLARVRAEVQHAA